MPLLQSSRSNQAPELSSNGCNARERAQSASVDGGWAGVARQRGWGRQYVSWGKGVEGTHVNDPPPPMTIESTP